MSRKYKIGVISASNSMVQTTISIGRERGLDITGANFGLDDAIPAAREMETKGVEVLLARGGTVHLIRDKVHIPVLSFPVSTIDVISCLKQAASMGHKILLISFRKKMKDIEVIEDLLKIELVQGICYNIDDLVDLVIKHRNTCDVVVGGATTVRIAIQYGLKAVETLTSTEAISATLDNALSVAQSSREEQEKAQRYRHIIDAVTEGIIALDRHGKIVTLNRSAQTRLKIKDTDFIEKPVEHLLPDSSISDAIAAARPIHDSLEKFNDETYVFNHIPILFRNEPVGFVSTFNDISKVMKAENEVRQSLARGFVAHYAFTDIISENPLMKNVIQKAKQFARTHSTILITGETGTGKEVLAQSIHNFSGRRNKPFVSVNCAAIPEQLLESELFGYEEGAFTGSKKGGKPGFFEISHHGTIFLDEIASTTQRVQMQLLRVLQERNVMRIGGDRMIPIDVRVIAATNQELGREILNQRFREDLYFRLNVLYISLPPLRSRIDDIPLLINNFIKKISSENGITPLDIPRTYMEQLKNYSWPGNIRQLWNFAERISLLCGLDFNAGIFEELFAELLQYHPQKERKDFAEPDTPPYDRQLKANKSAGEEEIIRKALEAARYNKSRAAKLLGISRTTLWSRLKALNL